MSSFGRLSIPRAVLPVVLLELNPYHPSLRLNTLQGRMSSLSSVSINISCRIVIEFIIEGDEILLVNIGKLCTINSRIPSYSIPA